MSNFKPYLYGAYGSNLNQSQMAIRCPAARPVATTSLSGYALKFRRVADIEPQADSSVPLGLWAITDACERALDRYEGFPHLYRKRRLTTPSGPVMVYVMNDQSNIAPPSNGYLETIKDGYTDFRADIDTLLYALKHSYAYETI